MSLYDLEQSYKKITEYGLSLSPQKRKAFNDEKVFLHSFLRQSKQSNEFSTVQLLHLRNNIMYSGSLPLARWALDNVLLISENEKLSVGRSYWHKQITALRYPEYGGASLSLFQMKLLGRKSPYRGQKVYGIWVRDVEAISTDQHEANHSAICAEIQKTATLWGRARSKKESHYHNINTLCSKANTYHKLFLSNKSSTGRRPSKKIAVPALAALQAQNILIKRESKNHD